MQFDLNDKFKSNCFLNLIMMLFLLLLNTSFAAHPNIVIIGNTIINTPTVYKQVSLDLTNGRFTVNPGGSLDIEDCTINVNITNINPYAVSLIAGSLSLKNNIVNVSSQSLPVNPNIKSIYQLLQIHEGVVNLDGNTFLNDQAFTLTLLETMNFVTNGISISNNKIKNFHGGLYLTNSNNVNVYRNTFENVSLANIFITGAASKFDHNIFLFPGNLVMGDAFDIVNSNGMTISNNVIASSSHYGIYIAGGQNIFIDNNQISDGSSFAIYIDSPSLRSINQHAFLSRLFDLSRLKSTENSNIVITYNYLALNRYGLAAKMADHMIVTNNIFLQRFIDNSVRQHWTNNDVLLPQVTNLIWQDNVYKEAFTQEVPGDNSNTLQFVTFPQHGGVSIPQINSFHF